MSLLMDALKKADKAVDTQPAKSNETPHWNDELLPQFQIDSQLDEQSDNKQTDAKQLDNNKLDETKLDDTTISEWDDDFLPQFKEKQANTADSTIKDNVKPDSTVENIVQPDSVNAEAETKENLIAPPVQAEIKLPNTDGLPDVDKVQTLFSLTDKQHPNNTEELQIPILDIDEQSPLENTATEEKNTIEESQFKEKYQPQDAQRIFTTSVAPNSSKHTNLLLGILAIIIIAMGIGYFYLQSSINQSSSIKFGNLSQRPTFNSNPVKHEEPVPVVNIKPISPPVVKKPIIKPTIKPTVKPATKSTQAKIKPPVKKVSAPLKKPVENKIHTLQKKKVKRLNKDLIKAYKALQNGNNNTAKRTYQQVLHQDKNNRNALLGLAALAVKSNNLHQAQKYYEQILRNYPKDINAQVGLINSFGNTPKNETKLKLLLRQVPKAAYIHFSLGNLYASQGRWELAQQAYFDAMRYNKRHAGYAYNLAISLDRINQPQAALTYYKRALDLVKNKPISFNPATVRKRIDTLTKNLK